MRVGYLLFEGAVALECLLSVCTGTFLLAATGMLKDFTITTQRRFVYD